MELIKENWTKQDIQDFYHFENILKGDKKDCEWEQKIVATKLECFAKTSLKAKQVAKQILKGNYFSFLDEIQIKTHFDSIVCANIISHIKNFEVFEKYLDKYVLTIDNWASCDTLSFKNKPHEKLFCLSQKYLTNQKLFIRRVGVDILFTLIDNNDYIEKIFDVLNSLISEQEYYVNMCGAWLLCECFVKQREKTLQYFKLNSTNSFIINKAISKCRDSFRVSNQDKKHLLSFKR